MQPHRSLPRLTALAAVVATLSACADGLATAPTSAAPRPLALVAATDAVCSTIDFSAFTQGAPVTSVSAAGVTFTVTSNPYANDMGAANPNTFARAWDTDAVGNYEDGDLLWNPLNAGARCAECRGLGRILIVEDERGWSFWGDSPWGGEMTFTAPAGSGSFYVKQFTSVDQDGSGAPLSLFYDGGASAVAVSPLFGDGRVGQVPVAGAQQFTSRFTFRLGTAAVDGVINSGGVDNIEVCRVSPPTTPPPTNPGTGTIGYWKNHAAAWPMTSITIGGVTYTREQAIALMQRATKSDKTYNLFEQLVAAKLNVAAGNAGSCVSADIAAADAWLVANKLGSGVGASSAAWTAISGTFTRLDQYNNGLLCAPHRG